MAGSDRGSEARRIPSFSILIETENLATADLRDLDRCLESLARQDLPPTQANEVVLLDSGDAPEELLATLRARYPWVTVAGIAAGSGYYDAKMQGAARATGDIVIFGDSDCVYEPTWLRSLLAPFSESPDVHVVAGETTTPVASPYGVAMALTYIFPRWSQRQKLAPAPGYHCNNVAFRRELLQRHPIPSDLPIYRGHCVVHAQFLRKRGYAIWRQPNARATHALPEGFSHFFWRFLLLGDEALSLARLRRQRSRRGVGGVRPLWDGILCAALAGGHARQVLRRSLAVFSQEPHRLAYLPVALPIAGASSILYCLGVILGYVRPGFLLATFRRLHES